MLPTIIDKFMSSREIAASLDSSHDVILKSVRNLVEKGVVFCNETPYLHEQNGQYYPEFLLSFRDSMVVASGFSAALRARVVDRWLELETSQPQPQFKVPQTFSEALLLAGKLQAENEQQQLLLEQQKPAVEFLDRYVQAKSDKGFREVAKILGIKERVFIQNLIDGQIIFRQGPNLLPFANYQHSGYFTVKTGETNGHAFNQTRFTPAGIAWIAKRFI